MIKIFEENKKINLYVHYRRQNNREKNFVEKEFILLDDFITLLEKGMKLIEKFCDILLYEYILDDYKIYYEEEKEFFTGINLLKNENLFNTRKMKLKEYLKLVGITV